MPAVDFSKEERGAALSVFGMGVVSNCFDYWPHSGWLDNR